MSRNTALLHGTVVIFFAGIYLLIWGTPFNFFPSNIVEDEIAQSVEPITLLKEENPPPNKNAVQEHSNNDDSADFVATPEETIWSFNGSSWEASGVVPNCKTPFVLETPVDMPLVSGALWPGQVRGNSYKGHGGFRFIASTQGNIAVTAPIGGYLVQASRYLSQGDEQYLLFFSVPCGYFYRLDHIRTLSPKLKSALALLPPATEGDSRTTQIKPLVWVEQGELIATQVGILPDNIFIDFGLYDVRKQNKVSPDNSWADLYKSDKEFGQYGVCFFDFLPNSDREILRSLPTGIEGKKSDYCT